MSSTSEAIVKLQAENKSLRKSVADAMQYQEWATPQLVQLGELIVEHDQLKSYVVSTTRALQAAERIIELAHKYWDSDQETKVGKLLIAMLRDDIKYSDDCTIFRTGIQAIAQSQSQPQCEHVWSAGQCIVRCN